ncbi:MAG: hypothetical protein A2W11_03065 [Ignavibacteria bacterium RBG_16_35_7]|nr:MAG: hypothetical protein A2W11_03065 [Ignavibacteria bacterium RBG_16_35_7]
MPETKEWLDKEVKLVRYKRKYLHFDRKVNPARIANQISNPEFIIKRAFWPFIESTINFQRYKKDIKNGSRKIENKSRKICYASHFDSEIYSYYNFILSDHYEKKLLELGLADNIIAYRSIHKKCNIHFASEVFDKIKEIGSTTVLTFDIEKFFDTLDHELLLKNWKFVSGVDHIPENQYAVFKSITKFASVKKEELEKLFDFGDMIKKRIGRICSSIEFREIVRKSRLINKNTSGVGIPQGSPISGLLSNIYMIDFDIQIKNKIEKLNGYYRRYSDDLIILCPPGNSEEIKNYIIDSIKSISKLEINPDKTSVVIFTKNAENRLSASDENAKPTSLQYLGFEFNGENLFIRSSSVSRYYRKMARGVKKAKIQSKYSKSNKSKVFKRKLYRLYSHLGKRNFISYAYRSSIITKSLTIKKQLSKHWFKLHQKIYGIKNEN